MSDITLEPGEAAAPGWTPARTGLAAAALGVPVAAIGWGTASLLCAVALPAGLGLTAFAVARMRARG